MLMKSNYSRPIGLAISRFFAEGFNLEEIVAAIPRHQPAISRWKRTHPELSVLHALGALLHMLNEIAHDRQLDARWRRIRDELEAALYAPPRHQAEFLNPVLEELADLFGPGPLAKAIRSGPGRELVLRVLAQRDGGAAAE